MVKLPEIRIKNAWLLREHASVHLHELWGKDSVLASYEEIEEIVKAYQQAWNPLESKVLTGMCSVLGLDFRKNIIDVHIAPWFSAFSDPLIIGIMNKPDVFIDTLTHELLHCLLTDNVQTKYDRNTRLKHWESLFGKDHSFSTLIHIPVHAVHKHIYLDVLNDPERYNRDVKNNKKHNALDYIKAWEYVDSNDYMQIIDKLKKDYKNGG